jgi:hypothetical protein
MRKMALFVFNGDPMCFIHVLLNALDMKEKTYEVKVIIEGAATKLVTELVKSDNPLHTLWEKAKSSGLVDGVCKACSNKMGALEAAKKQNLTALDEMTGHPSMARYREQGFEIVSF